MTIGEHGRQLVAALTADDGWGIPSGYYTFLLTTLPEAEARHINWFTEACDGRTYITEEALVGLIDVTEDYDGPVR